MKLTDLRRAARYDGLFWRRLAYLGSAHGPWWWRRYSPAAFGAAFYGLLGSRRRAVRANQRTMRPDRGALDHERATLETFLAYARCLTDSLEMAGPNPPAIEIEEVGEEHLESILREGKGAVMVTAHVGNWELFGRLVAGKGKGYPLTVAMAREPNATVRGFAERLRDELGVEVLYTDDTVFAALDLLRAVRQNRILAVQIDRPTGGPGDHVVPFFGVPTRFPLGPFLLAKAASAPILPVLTFLSGHHRYRVEAFEPIKVGRGRGRGGATEALEAVVRIFEARIREHPEQWFHFTELGESVPDPQTPRRLSPMPRGASRGSGSS